MPCKCQESERTNGGKCSDRELWNDERPRVSVAQRWQQGYNAGREEPGRPREARNDRPDRARPATDDKTAVEGNENQCGGAFTQMRLNRYEEQVHTLFPCLLL